MALNRFTCRNWISSFIVLNLLFALAPVFAADQPQWGQAWSRNMISNEKNLPDSFNVESGANVKWSAKLGTQTFSTPIVAGGRVYIGTNNGNPRDTNHVADSGVLMCFDEKTGAFLWQLVVPKREDDPFCDWPKTGWSSPVTVEGDRIYVVSSRGEVLCLDARGMANGNDGPFKTEAEHMTPRGTNGTFTAQVSPTGKQDGDILWLFDLTREAGIWSHDGAHSSILIDGDFLYLNSGTGVDNTHKVIRTPNAPSLVVLDKKTGKYLARDQENIAPDIFHCTWSPPSLAKVNGRKLIFFAGGNGMVYAFEALKRNFPSPFILSPSDGERKEERGSARPVFLKKIWQFDFDPSAPKKDIHSYLSNRREGPSNFYGMPVFHDGKIYLAGGGDIFWGKNEAWLKCIDATKTGDVSSNDLVWSYPLQKHVLGTPAIFDGMVFLADNGRTMHCVDAKTGKPFWTHEIQGEVWASPTVADGKVFLGARNGYFWIFAANKEKKILGKIQMKAPINGTVTVANKTLFIATMHQLFAISSSMKKDQN